ncbi:hypothetical protein I4U23_003604 [Adineta vaga]|nr:hypothetical protein I4U23_003604 [Adineta vaga]
MGNASSIDFIALNRAINRYVPMPLLFFGIIGNILNLFIFTRKTFHNNICVIYFLGSTIFDSFVIIVGLLPRLFNGYGIDLSQNFAILSWFIGFACIERYLSSSISVYKRQWFTKKRTYASMIIILIFGFIAFGEHFYCIDINQNLFGAPQSCYQLKLNTECQIMDSLLQLIFEILIPVLMMIIFGFLTVQNIHNQRSRINAVQIVDTSVTTTVEMIRTNHLSTFEGKRNIQKRDAQLLTMLLVQVGVFAISTFPIGVYKLYSIATIHEIKSTLQRSIENTIFNISVISLFFNNCITFYIYTLFGSVFRRELVKLFRSV